MGERFEWSHEDRYLSNNGKGPLVARIVCATDKEVTIQHWNIRNPDGRRRKAVLSLSFFRSRKCGWKLAADKAGERSGTQETG